MSSPTSPLFVVIPTYNERENIVTLIEKLAALPVVQGIVVVDDHSPDGTAALARQACARFAHLRCVVHERINQRGLGSAYQEGFRIALEQGAGLVAQIDADHSHDPAVLVRMTQEIEQGADVVVGSRRVAGGDVSGWSTVRNWGSIWANMLAHWLLHLSAHDLTSGFRVLRRSVVEHILRQPILSNGYAFQVELMYVAASIGARITEVPITFVDRQLGRSKLSRQEVWKFFVTVLRLKWRDRNARFVLGVLLVTTVLSAIPIVYAKLVQPDNTAFTAITMYSPIDFPVYYSTIHQVSEGATLTFDQFTAEPHQGMFYLVWFAIGVMARWFSLEPWTAFHLARIALVPVFVLVAWWCVKVFLPERMQRFGLLMLIFGSGTGAFLNVFLQRTAIKDIGMDVWVPEGFSFMSMLQSAHFIAGLICIMLVLAAWFRAAHADSFKRGLWWTVLSGGLASLLFSFHPFHSISLGMIVVSHAFILLALHFTVNRRLVLYVLMWALLALPGVAYQFWLQLGDPILAARAAQNLTYTPSFQSFFLCYTVLILLSIPGIRALWRAGKKHEALFLGVWCVVQSLSVFAPTHVNRRLVMGLQIGLSLLATAGWVDLLFTPNRLGKYRLGNLTNAQGLAIVLFFISSVFAFVTMLRGPSSIPDQIYIPPAARHAFEWIEVNTPPRAVVLAHGWYANLLPGEANRTVYVGHWIETIKSEQKWQQVQLAYTTIQPAQLNQLLQDMEVQYVFVGPEYTLAPLPRLRLVFQEDGFRVYGFNPLLE